MKIPSTPFKVLVLAPFQTSDDAVWGDDPIRVEKAELDTVINRLSPSFYLSIPRDSCPAGGFDIKINRFKDFHPDRLLQNNEFLKNLLDAKHYVEKAKKEGRPISKINKKINSWPNLPALVPEPEKIKPPETSGSAVDRILDMVSFSEPEATGVHTHRTLESQIDGMIKKILSLIFSNHKFIELESIWQGTRFFLKQGIVSDDFQLEIVPVSFDTLENTLDTLTPELIKDLPSLIILDIAFDNSAVSMALLEKTAIFAETLMVPTVCWVNPLFFYLDTWDDLTKLPFLPNYLAESQFAKWRKIQEASSGKWLSMTCNRFPARYPYGKDNKTKTIDFNEKGNCRISPVWAVASLAAKSYASLGWASKITGRQEMTIEDLPFDTNHPKKPVSTEARFTRDRIDQFIRSGIMPLVGVDKKDIAFFPAETTIGKGSLNHQLFLSAVTRFLFWCLDSFSKDAETTLVEKTFIQAFSLFFEKTGHPAPEDLSITAGPQNAEGKIPLFIELTPPSQILHPSEKVVLDLMW